MLRKFNSIAFGEKYGYAFDSDVWEYNKFPFLNSKMRMFETYGDGLCQHSHDWAVSEDFAIDYLNSLAVVMLEDPELAESVERVFGYSWRPEVLKFAASLVFDPEKDSGFNKQRYFSIGLLKVTRNQEKRHDDRYTELNAAHTGTPEAIFNMCIGEFADGLGRWQYARSLRDWGAENLKNFYMEMPAVFLKWFKEDSHKAREFRDAFEACESIARSYRDRKNGEAQVQAYRQGIQRKAEREALQLAEDTAVA